MFQFPSFAPAELVTCLQHAGLPHSDITGSKPVCSSPALFAAYHVLHRLQKPRHPPSALVTFSLFSFDLNHKNFCAVYTMFSFTRCLEIVVHNYDRLSIFYSLQTNFISSLTLPRYLFSNLSMNLPFFLKRAAKIRTFSLPANFSIYFFQKKSLFFYQHSSIIYTSAT